MSAPASFARSSPIPSRASLLEQPDRPTALYVANGVMALGVMRAIADLGLRCPADISIASTDTIAGHRRASARGSPGPSTRSSI